MIIGMGFDLVELIRIEKAYKRFGENFLRKVYTDREIATLPLNAVPYLSARFAAKEAAVKALGTGFSNGITPNQIETVNLASGQPQLRFLQKAHEHFLASGANSVHISLTHGKDIAGAVVILEQFA